MSSNLCPMIASASAFISFMLVLSSVVVCEFYTISAVYENKTEVITFNGTLRMGIFQGGDYVIDEEEQDYNNYRGCREYNSNAWPIGTTGTQKAGMAFSILALIFLPCAVLGMLYKKNAITIVCLTMALVFNMLMFIVFEPCNSKQYAGNIFDLQYYNGTCGVGQGSIMAIVSVVLLAVSLSATTKCVCCLPSQDADDDDKEKVPDEEKNESPKEETEE